MTGRPHQISISIAGLLDYSRSAILMCLKGARILFRLHESRGSSCQRDWGADYCQFGIFNLLICDVLIRILAWEGCSNSDIAHLFELRGHEVHASYQIPGRIIASSLTYYI